MLSITQIKKLFMDLNLELEKINISGEIGICGGAVMCLVFNARQATKDIDAIFMPAVEIRKAAKKVAHLNGMEEDWLNDAAKFYFHADPPKENVLQLSHLRVWAPSAKYMLAMKAISARFDSHDKNDLQFLIRYLSLKSVADVFAIVSQYYPKNMIPAKTQFLVEELFEKMGE